MSAVDWEQSKENAAPLRGGRKVETLGRKAFGINKRDETERRIEEFEQLVRPSEDPNVTEMEDDPLRHWLSYIKFYQEAFPSDTHEQFLLMERCTRAFIKMRQYANDDRFIGVCAKYADKTKEPMTVFKYLHQEKIGTESALLWVAWAFVAERDNDYQFAEKIFKKGISKNAQPLELLKRRHKQFERRMSKVWMNSSQQSDQLDDEDDGNHRRRVLGGVTHGGASITRRGAGMMQHTDRNRTFGVRQTHRSTSQGRNSNTNTSNANEFSVYEDQENGDDGYDLDQSHGRGNVMEKQAERRKENTMEAERWNQRGGLRRSQDTHQRSHTKGPPPAFAVFVDEECAAQHEAEETSKRAESELHRRCRDDRTFRERDDEGMAEKLARDPLRYLKDRTQFESDTAIEKKRKTESSNQPTDSEPKSKSDRRNKKGAGFDMRLLRNSQGEEQSFEEARANAKYYTLLPSSENFNLLHTVCDEESSQMDLDESSDGMSTAGFPEELATNTNNVQRSLDVRNDSTTSKKSIFQSSFDGSLNRTAISCASSTIDEIGAVGVPTKREEETINTKFAMRELSMMFSSPAVGADDMARKTERAMLNRSINANESYDHVMNIMDHQQMNNSIFNIEEDENDENDGERNDEGRSTSTPGFHDLALRELDGDQGDRSALSCRVQQRRGIPRQLSQENPLPQNEVELHSEAGFQIYEDDRVGENQAITAKSSFAIFEDEPEAPKSRHTAAVAKQSFTIFDEKAENTNTKPKVAKTSFAIFEDDTETNQPMPTASKSAFTMHQDKVSVTEGPRLSIFEDGEGDSPVKDVKRSPQSSFTASENGETATFSLFEGAIEMLGGNDDNNLSRSYEVSAPVGNKRQSSGDTASVSLFNEAFAEFGIETKEKNGSPLLLPTTRKHNFDIFLDEDVQDSKRARPSESKTRQTDPSPTRSKSMNSRHQKVVRPASLDYLKIHELDSQQALNALQQSSIVPHSDIPLASLLASSSDSFDLPHMLVPRVLRRKAVIPSKTELSIGGKYSGHICNELGRGAYGVVVLMKKHKSEEVLAVKSQTPTSCLALEFQLLRKLQERVGSNQCCYPFPQPLSFVSLADGGILSMTAGSRSGLNIVDLSNAYKVKLGDTVPELLALHYTSRMLKHVETLHSRGRVLHCDVKPDNFVLCSLDCPENVYRQFEHSDLFLVDFGRAIDLGKYSEHFGDDMNVMFHGNASCRETRCVAMRTGMPWSFDIDTFGILLAAHVMLFGKHMELWQSKDSRWHIQIKFRRYWNKDLWGEIFDSLFYLDTDTGLSLGSTASSLRKLRGKIDDYLKGEEAQIETLLKRQATILPKTREQLG